MPTTFTMNRMGDPTPWSKLLDLEPVLLQKAVLCLATHIPPHQLHQLSQRMRSDPRGWPYQDGWHFAGGMSVRNLLREKGFGEGKLGVGNLDDYYIQLLELTFLVSGIIDGSVQPERHPWWSRLLCRIGSHSWRNGPGQPCTVCGKPDDIWSKS